MNDDDPFDDAHDPYAARLPRVGRRAVLAVLSVAPVALGASACTAHRTACVVPGEAHPRACAYRFCRYHAG